MSGTELAVWPIPALFAGALLYAFVGHGGHGELPATGALPGWAVAVGGWLGAEIGSRRIAPVWIRKLLAMVLEIAGSKLAFV